MKTYPLCFAYKGSRQYIHGTDIFNACVGLLAQQGIIEIDSVNFVVNNVTEANLIASVSDKAPTEDGSSIGSLVCQTSSGTSYWVTLTEATTRPETRIPYDETRVVRCCDIDAEGRCITLTKEVDGFSPVEVFVSMVKALHEALFPEKNKNWVFCRWTISHWPLDRPLILSQLKLMQSLGTRLTRTELTIQNKIVGSIFFSSR